MRDVDVAEARQLLDEGGYLLDVREVHEFSAGRAEGARNVPLAEVPDALESLPRDTVIVCICRSGARSARAGSFLEEQGFDVVNLAGGTQAWHAAGAPLVADEGEPSVV